MSIEVMLNAVNIALVAFNRSRPANLNGQMFTFFLIAAEAAEVAVGLAIVLSLFRIKRTVRQRRGGSPEELRGRRVRESAARLTSVSPRRTSRYSRSSSAFPLLGAFVNGVWGQQLGKRAVRFMALAAVGRQFVASVVTFLALASSSSTRRAST